MRADNTRTEAPSIGRSGLHSFLEPEALADSVPDRVALNDMVGRLAPQAYCLFEATETVPLDHAGCDGHSSMARVTRRPALLDHAIGGCDLRRDPFRGASIEINEGPIGVRDGEYDYFGRIRSFGCF